jgi:WD40 repeat protein/energy-coupling factor transporter ATP-binding protein EcfA2
MSVITENQLQKNPYPGIRSFEIEESELFFGRGAQIKDLYSILDKTKFIAITGASGSGKSSLVKAGLIPELHKDSKTWMHHIFRPGNDPIGNFARSVSQSFKTDEVEKYMSPQAIEKLLRESNTPFKDIFLKHHSDKQHLIYIDQFEEIFRFRQSEYNENAESDSNLFVEILIKASKLDNKNIYNIITLRTDFLSDCSNFAGLTKIINDGHYLIPKMTLAEKEEALTGPAKTAGAEISDELINLIQKQLRTYDISLPVYQHALMRTWDYWLENAEYGKAVDVEHYEAIGGVTDALSVHAEYIYSSLPDENSKKIAEKIFKSLTHLGDDNRGTRSPKSLEEIISIVNARKEDVIPVIDKFRDIKSGFLLPSTEVKLTIETIIDISHESIMRVWSRLVQWVQNETESAQLYLRISKSAELYQEGKTGLMVNPDLQLALKWQDENQPNEVWAKRYDPAFDRAINYLNHSKKKWKNDIAAKEEKQKRGLRRARFFAIFLGSASLISILFMVIALNLKFKADDSRREALEKEKIAIDKSIIAEQKQKEAVSHKLIAEQQMRIADEQRLIAEQNKLYAVNQQREAIYQKQLAEKAKLEAIKARDIARELQIKAENLADEAYQNYLTAEDQRARAELSEARTDTLRRLAIAKSLSAQAIKIYRNNKKVQKLSEYEEKIPSILALQAYYFNKKYKGNDNDPDIFSALSEVSEAGIAIRGKNMHTDGIRSLAVSKDAEIFASCSDDGTVKVFKLSDPQNPVSLSSGNTDKLSIRSIDISETGKEIIAGLYNGDIYYWKNTNPDIKPKIIKGHTSVINSIQFIDDDNSFISASNDGKAIKWDIHNETVNSEILYEGNTQITYIAADTSDTYCALGTDKGTIILFPIKDTDDKTILSNEEHKKVSSISWINGTELVAGYSDGIIRFINNNEYGEEFFAHQSGVTSLFFDPNFDRIISSSYDGTIKIWNRSNIKLEPISLLKHTSWVYCVAADSEGTFIISGGADKQIVITPVITEELVAIVRDKVSKNMRKEDWDRFVGKDIEYKTELPKN